MHEVLTVGVERYDIQFALVTAHFSTPDFDIPSDEITLILIPFSDELLQMVGCHGFGRQVRMGKRPMVQEADELTWAARRLAFTPSFRV